MENKSLQDYIQQFYTREALRGMIRSEATAISFPIPEGENLHFFAYEATIYRPGHMRITRPYAQATVHHVTFELVEMRTGADVFAGVEGEFPVVIEEEIDLITIQTQLASFDDLYQIILKWYPEPQPEVAMNRFRQLFHVFVPEALLPFYRAMNGQFARWAGL